MGFPVLAGRQYTLQRALRQRLKSVLSIRLWGFESIHAVEEKRKWPAGSTGRETVAQYKLLASPKMGDLASMGHTFHPIVESIPVRTVEDNHTFQSTYHYYIIFKHSMQNLTISLVITACISHNITILSEAMK